MVATRSLTAEPAVTESRPTKAVVHSIGIAGILVCKAPDRIKTVLGSCVGIALYDCAAKLGGMAHIILPSSKEGTGAPGKFADTAIDLLIEELITAGAERRRIEAKIAGGASMFGGGMGVGLGTRNVEEVSSCLQRRSVRLAASAVGGAKGRKMSLDPATGEVRVEIIGEQPQTI